MLSAVAIQGTAITARAEASSCSEGFSSSATLARAGSLLRARDALVMCAADTCPAAMRPLCAADLRAMEARIPTVVLAATADARDVTDVRVTVDGRLLASTLDGRAVELDPGTRLLRFERAGEVVEQASLVREGEKNRVLSVAFLGKVAAEVPAPMRAGPETGGTRPVPLRVWLAAGATVLGAGFWAGFGASGFAQKSTLDACKGSCSHDAVTSARSAFLAADIAGGMTLGFAALTTALFLTRPRPAGAPSVGLVYVPGGAHATLAVGF